MTAGETATKTRAYEAEESEDKPRFTPERRQCRVLPLCPQVSQCCLLTAYLQVAGRLTWAQEHLRCICTAQGVKRVTTLVVCFTRCDDCCISTAPRPFPCYEITHIWKTSVPCILGEKYGIYGLEHIQPLQRIIAHIPCRSFCFSLIASYHESQSFPHAIPLSKDRPLILFLEK